MTGPQWQARMDAEGATLDRGRDACSPARKPSGSWSYLYMGYAAIIGGAVLFVGLGGLG